MSIARMTVAEFPHGLTCIECSRPILAGEEYRERLLTLGKCWGEDCATVEIICVGCDEKETGDAG